MERSVSGAGGRLPAGTAESNPALRCPAIAERGTAGPPLQLVVLLVRSEREGLDPHCPGGQATVDGHDFLVVGRRLEVTPQEQADEALLGKF